MSIIDFWLKAAGEAEALRHQVAYLEAAWLRAEADADYWYAQANNPEQALKLQERRAASSCNESETNGTIGTSEIDTPSAGR